MNPYSHPFYSLQLDIAGCLWLATLDGAPIYEETAGHPLTIEFPLQAWIGNGVNRLRFDLAPLPGASDFGPHAAFTAVVYVRGWNDDRSTRIEVSRIAWPPLPGSVGPEGHPPGGAEHPSFYERTEPGVQGEASGVLDSPPGAVDQPKIAVWRDFMASVPFRRWRWRDAAAAANEPATADRLWDQIEKIHGHLATGNVDALVRAVAARNMELAECQYKLQSERVSECRAEYARMVEDPGLELAPLVREGHRLRLFAGGRLALIDAWHGRSPIYFINREAGYAEYLPFVFCKDEESGWIVIR